MANPLPTPARSLAPNGSPHRRDPRQAPEDQIGPFLRRGELKQVEELFGRLASTPARFEAAFNKLRGMFARAERADLFLDLLLGNGRQVFRRLALVAKTYEVALEVGRAGEVSELIACLRAAGTMPIPAWGVTDHLGNKQPLGPDIHHAITVLKYRGAPNFHEDLFGSADALSARVSLPRPFLDRLYAVSRFRSMPRPVWEGHVRTAFCLDQMTAEVAWGGPRPALDEEVGFPFSGSLDRFIDKGALQSAFARVSATRGTVVMTYHGGFLALAKGLFQNAFPKGIRMQAAPSTATGISVKENHRAALFMAVRGLQDGGTLLLAPDAGVGKLSSSIEVAGVSEPFADGAAFLAYEAECETAFFTIVRNGDRFVPLWVAGPVREPGERFNAFKARLSAFYGQRMTGVVTGAPWNLALRRRWVRVFGGPVAAS